MSKLPSIAVPVTRRGAKKGHKASQVTTAPPSLAAVQRRNNPPDPARQHRYMIGQQLKLVVAGNGIGRAPGTCRIVALLPFERGVYSYRVRNDVENFERIVVENDLALPDLP